MPQIRRQNSKTLILPGSLCIISPRCCLGTGSNGSHGRELCLWAYGAKLLQDHGLERYLLRGQRPWQVGLAVFQDLQHNTLEYLVHEIFS